MLVNEKQLIFNFPSPPTNDQTTNSVEQNGKWTRSIQLFLLTKYFIVFMFFIDLALFVFDL